MLNIAHYYLVENYFCEKFVFQKCLIEILIAITTTVHKANLPNNLIKLNKKGIDETV